MDFTAKHPRANAGDLEPLKVPLVVYVDGERKIIGEAVVDGETIYGTIGEDAGEKVVNYIDRGLGEFSIGHFPFTPPPIDVMQLGLFEKKDIVEKAINSEISVNEAMQRFGFPPPPDHLQGEG